MIIDSVFLLLALMGACAGGNLSVVQYLVDGGVDVCQL